MTQQAPVLVFDSGVGGITVAREIRRLMPELPLVYAADDAAFPYGAWDGDALARHCVATIANLVRLHRPQAVVIACNTASTLVLPPLRQALDIPVVGTVPAIKPAAERTRSGLVSVLATPGTVSRDYTFDLIRRFAPEIAITLVGSKHLASLAEDKLAGRPLDMQALAVEVAACFVSRDDRRTDVVVLACTHFPLLADELASAGPWPVEWLDPAPAIARRLRDVIADREPSRIQPAASNPDGSETVVSTSGADLPHLLKLLQAEPA